jgi:hypothetical protein
MANYTITRHTETDHTYGCTQFSTIQTEDQVAVDGGPLDSTVVWDVTADQGFSLDIEDFSFTGATQLNVPATAPVSTSWENLPYPILYAKMVKVSSVLIRVTLYLAPDASQPGFGIGNSFVMPSTDTNVTVPIEGCANLAAHSLRLVIEAPTNPKITTRADVNDDLGDYIASNVIDDSTDEVHGTLPSTGVNDEKTSTYLMSYQAIVEEGYRYKAPPNLDFTDNNYYTKRRLVKEVNPNDPTKKDIVSVSFDIYKK